jgi:hypothetical protein
MMKNMKKLRDFDLVDSVPIPVIDRLLDVFDEY